MDHQPRAETYVCQGTQGRLLIHTTEKQHIRTALYYDDVKAYDQGILAAFSCVLGRPVAPNLPQLASQTKIVTNLKRFAAQLEPFFSGSPQQETWNPLPVSAHGFTSQQHQLPQQQTTQQQHLPQPQLQLQAQRPENAGYRQEVFIEDLQKFWLAQHQYQQLTIQKPETAKPQHVDNIAENLYQQYLLPSSRKPTSGPQSSPRALQETESNEIANSAKSYLLKPKPCALPLAEPSSRVLQEATGNQSNFCQDNPFEYDSASECTRFATPNREQHPAVYEKEKHPLGLATPEKEKRRGQQTSILGGIADFLEPGMQVLDDLVEGFENKVKGNF